MSAPLQPKQFDELAAHKAKKFDRLLDQVPSFDEEIAESPKPPPATKARRRLRSVP